MTSALLLLQVLLLGEAVTAFPFPFSKKSVKVATPTFANTPDDTIILEVVGQLNTTVHNKDQCAGCQDWLAIGKNLAQQRPELVPLALTKWCLENGQGSPYTCQLNYGLNTVNGSSTGSNVADMLSGIDAYGYDGQLYCHYRGNGKCKKPATPSVSVSDMWPAKLPQHMVAPEPSWNDTFNVLHFSDFHIELDYTVGGEANCTTTTMCCGSHSANKSPRPQGSHYSGRWDSFYDSFYDANMSFVKGANVVPSFQDSDIWSPATSFGNYQCDAPELLVNSSLSSAIRYAHNHSLDVEFTLFTGDMIAHDESKYISLESTKESEQFIFRDMKTALGNIPVYAALGNHDSYPYGALAPEGSGFENRMAWNADLMSEIWQDYNWLNASEAQYAKTHYTGFSVETAHGLKVISLNSNAWLNQNYYAFLNASQPDNFGQFKFLIDELVASEANNQRVWIISHIPPATGGLPIPSNVFAEIVERFSPSTIAAIFFGHTHEDQFEVMYAGSGKDPKTIENVVNSAWIMQSITPFVGYNPSWRYYEVDRKTFSVMDAHNFYAELDKTYDNNGEEPEWKYEYSSRHGYNITWPETSPLNATYWHLVAEKINSSADARQAYGNYRRRFSPYSPNCHAKNSCTQDYCFVSTFTIDEYDDCIAALPKNK
ncbi:hypothetical protein DAKH74_010300 [Maudiozyma humilis]|uniref:Calcineurin-like phosphoesterase domain-containing protein n=1 Tax=Maudiozyma humilis TaxID=51915 RepID=A0AAV5RS71_MAUHU|nr:hypothetical protein DAKH74_010300 [Kazachstania humilis]